MLDADGDFVPKEQIRLRMKAADERSAASASLDTAVAQHGINPNGPDTEGLQATVSLSLNFVRQVKRPLQKARRADSGEPDEKQLAEIANAERDIKAQIHSRLVRFSLSVARRSL